MQSVYRQIGVYGQPYNLHPSLQEACHQHIRSTYIANNKNPETWTISEKLAPMEAATGIIYDYRTQLNERMGFDTTDILAFMTQYRGQTSLGIHWTENYVCLIQLKGGYLHFNSVLTSEQFEHAWSVKSTVPYAWIMD